MPSKYKSDLRCPVTEVVLAVEGASPEAMTGEGPAFEGLLELGKRRTGEKLAKLRETYGALPPPVVVR
jgi:hypothetical protein